MRSAAYSGLRRKPSGRRALAELRELESPRPAGGEEPDREDREQDASGPERAPVGLPGAVEPACAPDPHDDHRGDRDEGDEPEGEALSDLVEPGEHDAPVRDDEQIRDLDGLVDGREPDDDPEVPEQDDDEDRDVAERLDVERRGLPHEPVGGEARDADEDADDRGEHDPQERDLERVLDTDDQGVAQALRRAEVGVRNREAGRLVEVAEAGGDPEPLEVLDDVVDQVEEEPGHGDEEDRLEHEAEHTDVAPKRRPAGRHRRSGAHERRGRGRRPRPPPPSATT